MTEEEKKPYLDMREVDIARHKMQIDELASKGFFTTEEGIKSTDLKPKKKKVKRNKKSLNYINEDEPKIIKKQRIE